MLTLIASLAIRVSGAQTPVDAGSPPSLWPDANWLCLPDGRCSLWELHFRVSTAGQGTQWERADLIQKVVLQGLILDRAHRSAPMELPDLRGNLGEPKLRLRPVNDP
jgi:hypothetical protein